MVCLLEGEYKMIDPKLALLMQALKGKSLHSLSGQQLEYLLSDVIKLSQFRDNLIHDVQILYKEKDELFRDIEDYKIYQDYRIKIYQDSVFDFSRESKRGHRLFLSTPSEIQASPREIRLKGIKLLLKKQGLRLRELHLLDKIFGAIYLQKNEEQKREEMDELDITTVELFSGKLREMMEGMREETVSLLTDIRAQNDGLKTGIRYLQKLRGVP
jgi:hypothetical protein